MGSRGGRKIRVRNGKECSQLNKRWVSLVLAAVLLCVCSVGASAEEKYPLHTEVKLEMNDSFLLLNMCEDNQDGHRYWCIWDVGSDIAGDVVIPEAYDGFPIEEIYVDSFQFHYGFQGTDKVTSLTFPGTFPYLLNGGGWFSPSIKKITVQEGVGSFGGTFFPGVTEAHLPISMRAISNGSLYWWDHDITIYAPPYSAAQRYALDRDMKYVAEGGVPTTLTDIDGHWGEENILWAWHNKILMGVSETEFSPNTNMTRGMLAAAFGRQKMGLDWRPENGAQSLPYRDVKESDYFYNGCYYLYRAKAMMGKSETAFSPNDNITRQELAAVIFRMANYDESKRPGVKYSEENLKKYRDAGSISPWARQSVGWAVDNGILLGDSEMCLNPKGYATRAEVTTMLYRYQRYVELEELKDTHFPGVYE